MGYKEFTREYIVNTLNSNNYHKDYNFIFNVLMFYAYNKNNFTNEEKMGLFIHKITTFNHFLNRIVLEEELNKKIQEAINYCIEKFNVFTLKDANNNFIRYY